MIGLAAPTFDTEGAFVLEEDREGSNLGEITRRVSRRATLDGGAAFEDRGSFYADRTFTVIFTNPTRSLAASIQRLTETYRWLLVSTPEGLFRVAPRSAEITERRVRLTLLAESKRSG